MEYVLDSMQEYEIEPMMKYIYKRNMQAWERTRMESYIIAQVNSRKKITPNDIVKFEWDKKDEMFTGIKEISNEDVERLKLKSNNFITNGK